jgi:maltose phosphorylase
MYLLRKAKNHLSKNWGYTVSLNHKNTLSAAEKAIQSALALGYDHYWKTRSLVKIWEMSDITIEGDVKAQQGIRFNIFQLNQTYLEKTAD